MERPWSSPNMGAHANWSAVDKPHYHVAPESGWINDPNGPLYFNGTYHIFYQHLPGSAQWGFNLVWGHATSQDLVHWQLMDHAIEPTKGSVDNDGCFSGCAAVDTDGTPCLLYSAVRLRGSTAAGPLPPSECDLSLPFIETQCIVYADEPYKDLRLPNWRKSNVPLLCLPPAGLKLAGWRDPYVVGPPVRHPERGWTILIGSGIKEQGGTILVYRSWELAKGWKLAGELCCGKKEDGTGIVWECPLLAHLEPLDADRMPAGYKHHHHQNEQHHHHHHHHHHDHHQQSHPNQDFQNEHQQSQQSQDVQNHLQQSHHKQHAQPTQIEGKEELHASNNLGLHGNHKRLPRSHFFCISPDACTNPTLYYLGDYLEAEEAQGEHVARAATTMDPTPIRNNGAYGNNVADALGAGCPKFLVREALGPFKLDLGDILYAPNTLVDSGKGRLLLFAWLQEARKVAGTYTYAGCLCLPRELWLDYTHAPDRPFLVQRPLDEATCLRKPGHTWIYHSPYALPSRWVQDEAPALSGYKRPATAGAAPESVPHRPPTPSSHPLSIQGIKEMSTDHLGQISPSHAQRDVRSHPLNPFSRQSLNPDGSLTDLSGLTKEEQEAAHQLDSCVHGGPEEHEVEIAAAGDPLLLGPGQSFAVPVVEGPFLELEVVLELFTDGGRPQRARPRRGPAGTREAGRQQPDEAENGRQQGDVFVEPPEAELLEREGIRRLSGEHVEALAPPPVGSCSGVVLRSWQAGVEGAAAVLYCWDTGVLEVVFEALDPETHEYSLAAPGCRRVGSKLQRPPALGQPMALRLFIDYSLLEVYTGNGEVLSTRVYRGVGPPGGGAGVEVVSVGCNTHIAFLAAYEMTSCYIPDQQDFEEQLREVASRTYSAPDHDQENGSPAELEALSQVPKTPKPGVQHSGGIMKSALSEAEEIAEVRRQLQAAALGQSNGEAYEDKLLAALGISLDEETSKRDTGSRSKRSRGPSRRSSTDAGGYANGTRERSAIIINNSNIDNSDNRESGAQAGVAVDLERLGSGGHRGQDQLQGVLDQAAHDTTGRQMDGSRCSSLDSTGSLAQELRSQQGA
uniref:beta-fructofuranosidase n=1 Tax=Dunaliella tertiolecta TaxID=3047 RepID=A0A7S3QUF1_DUNTE|eukprot:CAMPEP_0202373236 /NCGR_PEP_ID=MMETSP1127-20130417/4287_1 /ASSEMBLY_ACC=CAM_ASM_000462 /TAXON_ID=3047 /ORGANISM="Dunaliella tertiolecta, Strain CCMP1320" /LENGTH=1074 /DNA_ID=CAMNT_0048970049 /DNA_START=118 /DNA_END=3342 /DNA_ORIENTATION=+